MNVTQVPNTPESMFTAVGVILGIGILIGIGYAIYKMISNG